MALLFQSQAAQSAIVAVTMDGNSSGDTWSEGYVTSANFTGYGSFPGNSPWPGAILSEQGGSDAAALSKVANGASGGPYVGGGSIYFGGMSPIPNTNGGTLKVQDASPLVNVANVLFQVNIGQAYGYDFFNNTLPQLTITYSGGTTVVSPFATGILNQQSNGTFTTPDGVEELFNTTYGLQWNLASYTDITNLEIQFNAVQHAQVYGLSLHQSDVFESNTLASLVPEPSHGLLCLTGLCTLIMRRRRRA